MFSGVKTPLQAGAGNAENTSVEGSAAGSGVADSVWVAEISIGYEAASVGESGAGDSSVMAGAAQAVNITKVSISKRFMFSPPHLDALLAVHISNINFLSSLTLSADGV